MAFKKWVENINCIYKIILSWYCNLVFSYDNDYTYSKNCHWTRSYENAPLCLPTTVQSTCILLSTMQYVLVLSFYHIWRSHLKVKNNSDTSGKFIGSLESGIGTCFVVFSIHFHLRTIWTARNWNLSMKDTPTSCLKHYENKFTKLM